MFCAEGVGCELAAFKGNFFALGAGSAGTWNISIRLCRGMASSPAGLRARPKSFFEKFCSCILPLLKGASSFSRFEDDEPSHEFKERMARASNAMKVSEDTKSRMDDEKRKAVEVVPVPLPPSERSSAERYDTASKLAALQK